MFLCNFSKKGGTRPPSSREVNSRGSSPAVGRFAPPVFFRDSPRRYQADTCLGSFVFKLFISFLIQVSFICGSRFFSCFLIFPNLCSSAFICGSWLPRFAISWHSGVIASKAKQSPPFRDCFGAKRLAMTISRSRVRRAFSMIC